MSLELQFSLAIRAWLLVAVAALAGCQPAGEIPNAERNAGATEALSKSIEANLGGKMIGIPVEVAGVIEYNGDPPFFEQRKVPERRSNTIRSASIYGVFRLNGDDASVVFERPPKTGILPGELVINVGIVSGEYYQGTGAIERKVGRFLRDWQAEMARLKSKSPDEFRPRYLNDVELNVFGTSDLYKAGYRSGDRMHSGHDEYFGTPRNGSGLTHIRCVARSNASVGRSMCIHEWSMEPAMTAKLSIQYHIELLPHWMLVQRSINDAVIKLALVGNK